VGSAGGGFQAAVGAVGNLVLVFHRFHGRVISTALREVSDAMRPPVNRNSAVQVLMDGHRLARQREGVKRIV